MVGSDVWAALLESVRPFWWVLAVPVAAMLAKLAWLLRRRLRLARAGLHQIDRMTGLEFEDFAALLFGRLGYEVEQTPPQGDRGADLVLTGDQGREVVQLKRSGRVVGVQAVQEVVASRAWYQADRAVVLTNSTFTAHARELAEANQVSLLDRADLERLLAQTTAAAAPAAPPAPVPPTGMAPPEAVTSVCAVCGRPVSIAAQRYCRDHPQRFGGRLYCPEHQRRRPS